MLLKGCLNGSRTKAEHPRCPITPGDMATDASDVVAAGAGALHVHPRDHDGHETFATDHISSALLEMRDRVAVPIGVSTGAWFLPDPADRLRAIERWDVIPDFASVNFHEAGAVDVARLLVDRGIGVEAGLWDEGAAVTLMDSDLAVRCLRLLFELKVQSVEEALTIVAAIERVTREVPPDVPRLLHGYERTAWPLLHEAARRGYQGRFGLEDTLVGRHGEHVAGNAELVTMAVDVASSIDALDHELDER